MLRISAAQTRVLREGALHDFDVSLGGHLAREAPTVARLCGVEALRAFASQARLAAACSGFDMRGPVRMFAELCLTCELHAADDYQFGFLGLRSGSLAWPQMHRAEAVFARFGPFHAKCIGTHAGILGRVIDRGLATERHLSHDAPLDLAVSSLAALWPEKAGFIGTAATFADCVEDAWHQSASAQSAGSRWRHAWFTLAFGSRYHENPLLSRLVASRQDADQFLRALAEAFLDTGTSRGERRRSASLRGPRPLHSTLSLLDAL